MNKKRHGSVFPRTELECFSFHQGQSRQATVTKCSRLDNLHDRHLFLALLDPEKSTNKAPADLVPSTGKVPGL